MYKTLIVLAMVAFAAACAQQEEPVIIDEPIMDADPVMSKM